MHGRFVIREASVVNNHKAGQLRTAAKPDAFAHIPSIVFCAERRKVAA